MEITVLKCDRCKKEVKGLIEFSFINRNVEPTENKEDESRDGVHLHNLMFGYKTMDYPTVKGGLCIGCIEEISRWLGHQENSLENTKC